MKRTSVFSKLEKVIYEFDAHDIRNALEKYARDSNLPPLPITKVEFDWEEDTNGNLTVKLTFISETEK